MQTAPNHLESLIAKAGEYAETKATLFKLKIADKASDTVSDAATSLVVLIFAVFFILIASIGCALLIGEWLGKSYYGFFAMAGVYGIAGIIFYVNRKNFVKNPVSNFIVHKMLNARK